MNNKYCYKIKITTIYQNDTEEENYLDGIYIDFDNAVDKADKAMRDILEGINSEHKKTEYGDFGTNYYWTSTYFKNHPKVESVYIETEQCGRILG